MTGRRLRAYLRQTTDTAPDVHMAVRTPAPAPPIFANATQLFNQAPHMLEMNWVPLVGGAVITTNVWNKLSQPVKEALLKAAAEAGEKMRSRSRKENDEAVEAMKKRGLIVHS